MMRTLMLTVLLLGSSSMALDASSIQKADRYAREQRGSALLIWQDGKEVHARGHNGFDLSRPHFLASGSKSFGCAMAVAMQADGVLHLDEPVSKTLQEWQTDPLKSQITVRQLLGFNSGLPGDVGPHLAIRNRDLYGAALQAPALAQPGSHFTYGNTHLAVFGELVKRKTGQDPALYLQQRVLDPLGVKAVWQRDRQGNPNLAGSAQMTARDWATFGQLMMQKGNWQGKTVLPAPLLVQCFQGSTALSAYGLTWWLNVPFNDTFTPDDEVPVRAFKKDGAQQQLAPGVPASLVMAAGAFNQRLYLLPDQNLVVVRFGEGGPWDDATFLKLLLGL